MLLRLGSELALYFGATMTAALSLMELCFAVLSIPVINSFVVSLGLICIE